MRKTCQAVAISSGEQCKKKALPGSRYCLFHVDKTYWFCGVVIGAILSFLIPMIWYRYVPSQELKELKKIKEQNTKFNELSEHYFPNLSKLEAVDKLSEAMEKLEELRPKDPDKKVTIKTFNSLKLWHNKYPNIHVSITLQNAATPNTKRITKNVYTLLKEAGIKTSENTPYMFILSSIASPIAVEFAPDLKKSAEELLKSLSTYIEGSIYFQSNESFEKNLIDIKFRGIPRFTKTGKVILE
ncbi:MAG: hypothetical protein PVH77_11290 [Phycisphaerales bacterium]|jgi:hypothetical protein